jgi:GT2 family glycosyltransferase
VIVVDNSVEVEEPSPQAAFPWIVNELNDVNRHFRAGVNQGVRRARLPYVLLLNPDAYLTDGESVAKLADALDNDPRIGFVGPKMRGDDGNLAPQGERVAGLAYLVALKGYVNALWPGNPIARWHGRTSVSRDESGPAETLSAAALLCRREQFLAIGGFDERAKMYWEEHELARKMRRLGLHGHYRADAFLFHHWRRGGTEHVPGSDEQRYFNEAMRLYYRTFYGRAGAVTFAALDRIAQLARRFRS